ncbi:hypothetical protein N7507_003544 [Penicillium longicatenatum]|nr:hypothetical protein N7507_003544 [Penicillium longicatenatum]
MNHDSLRMAPCTNDGCGPLHVPGYDSVSLNFELPLEARFAHGLVEYRHSPRLNKREMAMLRLMQHITEQSGWDRAMLDSDEAKLAEWYRNATEGTEGFLISTAVWSWCVAELRDKAETMQRTGRLLVFDSSSAVCQANVSMIVSLKEVQKEVAPLEPQPSQDCPLWILFCFPSFMAVLAFPWTSLADLWGQAGEVTKGVPAHPFDQFGRRPGHLERLIAASVPSWNEILFYGNTRGRNPPRILTYGCQVHNYKEQHKVFGDVPPFLDWRGLAVTHEEWQKLREAAREYITGPEPPKWKQANPLPRLATNLLDELTPEQWDVPENVNRLLRLKRRRLAWFEHPEPGVSVSYEQWKQGQFTGRAISPQRVGMFPDPLHHEHTPVQLEQTFKKDGLQVVVEINRIELTPENPVYPGDPDFHTQGLRNEHIVATSICPVETKNVTQARVAFEHEDKIHATELECEVPEALATVLDVDDWEVYEERPPRALHNFGSIPIAEGHLLSWLNTYRSKQESFRLKDLNQPGNMTLITLRLVDPHCRICSTRNVPLQQHDWWATTARQAANLDSCLPPELANSVMEQADWFPMSLVEARRLRENFTTITSAR